MITNYADLFLPSFKIFHFLIQILITNDIIYHTIPSYLNTREKGFLLHSIQNYHIMVIHKSHQFSSPMTHLFILTSPPINFLSLLPSLLTHNSTLFLPYSTIKIPYYPYSSLLSEKNYIFT